jgi:hypothetical protein
MVMISLCQLAIVIITFQVIFYGNPDDYKKYMKVKPFNDNNYSWNLGLIVKQEIKIIFNLTNGVSDQLILTQVYEWMIMIYLINY